MERMQYTFAVFLSSRRQIDEMDLRRAALYIQGRGGKTRQSKWLLEMKKNLKKEKKRKTCMVVVARFGRLIDFSVVSVYTVQIQRRPNWDDAPPGACSSQPASQQEEEDLKDQIDSHLASGLCEQQEEELASAISLDKYLSSMQYTVVFCFARKEEE